MVTIHHGPLDEVLRLEANLIYEESRKGVPLLNVQHHSGAAPKYSAPDTEKARLELQLEMAEMSRESLMVIIECQRKTIRAQASILGWALE